MKSSEFKDIVYNKDDKTGLVMLTLNRPERKNAMTAYTFLELWWAADTFQNDKTAQAMIITGSAETGSGDPTKEAFSSGGYFDPDEAPLTDGEEISEYLRLEMDLTDIAQKKLTLKLWEVNKPVIAAINGLAVGAGLTMSLACVDLIYVSEYAWAQLPFVSVGITQEFASSYILPRLLGFQKAKELIYFGNRITAQELLELGLINGVLAHDKLISYCKKQALKLIPPKGAGFAVRMAKQTLHKPLINNYSECLDLENKALNKAIKTSDFIEAIVSRSERRAPIYKGC